jgi:hypothetical protein
MGQAYIRIGYIDDGVERFVRSDQYPDFTSTANDDGTLTWTLSGHETAPDIAVVFTHTAEEGRLRADAVVSAPAFRDVRLTRFEPMRLDDGNGIRIDGLNGALHWYHHGYDSWAHTAVEIVSASDPAPRRDGSIARPSANNREWYTVRSGTGWWVGAGRVPVGNIGFVAGALSADRLKTYFAAEVPDTTDDRVAFDFVMGTPGDALLIPAGTTASMAPVHFQFTGDMIAGLDLYGRLVAETVPPLAWSGGTPRGWATWYDLFEDVTPADVRDHIDILSQSEFRDAGYRVLQIDDGYEKAFGDWDENDKFAVGMDALAAEIAAAGLVPGIWIAPLMVDETLPIVADNPDMFVHLADGSLRTTGDPLTGRWVCLDVTHPDGEAFLRETIRRFIEDGYTYLKLDFLFAGAVEGVRHDPDLTSLEAYALACDIISDEAGPDAFLLASGQPFLPSAGRFHAARTSDDIVIKTWDTTNYRMSGVIARYNAARFWAERLFITDPDNLALRERLTLEEAYATAVSNLLGGQNLFLGDDLRALPDERVNIALDPDLLALLDEPGPTLPLDLFDEAMTMPLYVSNEDWVRRENRPPAVWVRGDVLALVNFRSADQALSVRTTDLGLETDSRVRLTPVGAGKEAEFVNRVDVSVPARSAVVYRFREAP